MAPSLRVIILSAIFGSIFIGLFIIILIRMKKKRKKSGTGEDIENSIDPFLHIDRLERIASRLGREEKYKEAIIHYYYIFRSICSEQLVIRNAKIISSERLLSFVAGTPNLSLTKLKKITSIYNLVRYENNEPTLEEYKKVKTYIEDLIEMFH